MGRERETGGEEAPGMVLGWMTKDVVWFLGRKQHGQDELWHMVSYRKLVGGLNHLFDKNIPSTCS